ncbi:unnamed protein product [Thlaspi arvense]|uniref:Protein kinase domain-containing protein n=1 Tax=Thlaspi arvense TaxID=13288 RepID=A0AAU9SC92_THLAR|nr:unnamed protein product [Thlaspi arvense]
MVLVTLLLHLHLLPRLTLSATSTYSRPEKFYINCGSDSNVTYGNQTFIGDMSSGGNSVNFTNKGTQTSSQSGSSTYPEIYRTVRIFTRPSSYKFHIDPVGLHFLRLHFSALSSQTELSTARFTVSATSYLKSFSLQNFSDTPRVEEFLLMIDSPELKIRFVPDRSSVAFINAIEVFSAPDDLTILADSDKNLHTVYRLNVGGDKLTPENDTLGRTWSKDDDFLYRKDSAMNIQTTQKVNYGSGSATAFTAPDLVYQTAKTMNRSSTDQLMNVSWSLSVGSNSKHLIRVHFCDIVSNVSQSDFYLYLNSELRVDVTPIGLATPFYIDLVCFSDASGLLNVTIGDKNSTTYSGFLNGLEVMEFLEKSSNKSSFFVYVIAGCVLASFVLFLSLLSMVCLKRKETKKKNDPNIEVIPLRLYRAESSNSNNSGLKIPFKDILRATNNFDERWLIGRGGFGDVYKAILQDGRKAAIKRGKIGSVQGILEFQTEIQVLSRIWHKHLVSLSGYCDEYSEMILVYEFMEKEYVQTQILTEKSDVYAFGVLLEVLCARPALDRRLSNEEVNLAVWAMFRRSNGDTDEIIDPKLIGQIERSSLRIFMEIVEKCLKNHGTERPSMADVICDLEHVLQLHMTTTVLREPHQDSTKNHQAKNRFGCTDSS